jgi:twinkle protein
MKGQEAVLNCPFCGKEGKFSFNIENRMYRCFVCGEVGNIRKLKRAQGDWRPIEHITSSKSKPMKTFPDAVISESHAGLIAELRRTRGLTVETLRSFQIGFEEVNGSQAVVFPYFLDGKIVLQKKRLLDKKEFIREPGCPSVLFGLQNVTGKEVIVTEGEFDALAAFQLGYRNVVSVPNGANVAKTGNPAECEWLKQLDGFEKIHIAFDNDETGEAAARLLAHKLGEWRCIRWLLPEKDFNDYLMVGISDKDELDKLIKRMEYKDERLIHAKELLKDVLQYWTQTERSKGLQTRFQDLNFKLGGIRDSEITVLTGDTASGKTTLGLNVIENLIAQDVPCLIASTEMNPVKLMGKMFSVHSQKNFLNKRSFTSDDLTAEIDYWASKPLYFINVHGSLPLETIQNVISYAVKIYGVRFVMLDHLHYFLQVKRSEDERLEIERFVAGITKSSLENGIHIMLVCHPTKIDSGGERRVTMHNLRGSSRIYQDAHNVAVVWRDREHEAIGQNIVELDFQKVRDDAGRGGKVLFEFDYETQRFTETFPLPEAEPKEKRHGNSWKENIQYNND